MEFFDPKKEFPRLSGSGVKVSPQNHQIIHQIGGVLIPRRSQMRVKTSLPNHPPPLQKISKNEGISHYPTSIYALLKKHKISENKIQILN